MCEGIQWSGGLWDWEYRCTGPHRHNDAKLIVAREKKRHQNTHSIVVEEVVERDYWFRETIPTIRIRCYPLPEYAAKLRAEYQWTKEEYPHYRRIGEKTKRTRNISRGSRPQLDTPELLQEEAEKPRPRKQRGWGDAYLPTRKRRYARRDLCTWKRYRTVRYRTE